MAAAAVVGDFVKSLFHEKLIEDDRQPVATFRTPFSGDHQQWELLPPKLEVWKQLATLLILQTIFQVGCAVIVYNGIIKQRQKNPTMSYLIGWGITMPLSLYFPFELLSRLELQHLPLRLSGNVCAMIVFFRSLEAMYDTSPETVEHSLTTYILYYTSLMHFEWNPKTATRRKVSLSDLMKLYVGPALFLHSCCSVVSSFLAYNDYRPFGGPNMNVEDYHFNLFDLCSLNNLGNSYVTAVMVYLMLNLGFTANAVGDSARGLVYVKPSFFNPLFTSKSPSDFWGKKWNTVIQRVLKYGVFQPSLKIFQSKYVAIAATYIVSGLLHEYTNTLMFHGTGYDYRHGKLLAFFLWNGVVMLLERPVAKYILPGKLSNHLPLFVISTMVFLTALPVGHWYTGSWIAGGYFKHCSLALWHVRPATVYS